MTTTHSLRKQQRISKPHDLLERINNVIDDTIQILKFKSSTMLRRICCTYVDVIF